MSSYGEINFQIRLGDVPPPKFSYVVLRMRMSYQPIARASVSVLGGWTHLQNLVEISKDFVWFWSTWYGMTSTTVPAHYRHNVMWIEKTRTRNIKSGTFCETCVQRRTSGFQQREIHSTGHNIVREWLPASPRHDSPILVVKHGHRTGGKP